MSKIKCPKCGKICNEKNKFCPGCGESLEGVPQIESPHINGKLRIIFIVIILLIAAGVGAMIIFNLNPEGKYRSLVAQGKTEEANSLYEKKIAEDEELSKDMKAEDAEQIKQIYEQYKNEEITFEEAKSRIKPYMDSELSGESASSIMNSIRYLKVSRIAFEDGEQAEADGDVEKALSKFKEVVGADENYKVAQEKITKLEDQIKEDYISQAKSYADNNQFKEAAASIRKAISIIGSEGELEQLASEYENRKDEQYARIVVIDKSVTNKNIYAGIYSDYVNFVFDVTNNSDKDIKGIEGTLTICDLFGKEILTIGCDFTGHTIAPGETYRESKLSLECNQFRDEHNKLLNTDYSDLQFEYEISSIVFSDGTSVNPN